MAGGAPKGNSNAKKAKIWTAAIERALEKRSKEAFDALDEIADKLLQNCLEGDLQSLKELGDRLEGKPAQAIIGGGEDEPAIAIVGKINLVRPKD